MEDEANKYKNIGEMQVMSLRKIQADGLSANTFKSGICRLFYKKCLSEITSKRTLSQGIFLFHRAFPVEQSFEISMSSQALP